MGLTDLGNVNATGAILKLATSLPSTPASFYDIAASDVNVVAWKGGEMIYHTGENRLYIQQNTSGTTALWKRLLEQFETA